MSLSAPALFILATLQTGMPQSMSHASYQRGLFCDSVDLVASVVEAADKGGDPEKAVSDVNGSLDRRACFYTTHVDVLADVVKFERIIAAQNTTFGIYRVFVSGIGHQETEVGELTFKFSAPVVMYTLREAPPASSALKEAKPGT